MGQDRVLLGLIKVKINSHTLNLERLPQALPRLLCLVAPQELVVWCQRSFDVRSLYNVGWSKIIISLS